MFCTRVCQSVREKTKLCTEHSHQVFVCLSSRIKRVHCLNAHTGPRRIARSQVLDNVEATELNSGSCGCWSIVGHRKPRICCPERAQLPCWLYKVAAWMAFDIISIRSTWRNSWFWKGYILWKHFLLSSSSTSPLRSCDEWRQKYKMEITDLQCPNCWLIKNILIGIVVIRCGGRLICNVTKYPANGKMTFVMENPESQNVKTVSGRSISFCPDRSKAAVVECQNCVKQKKQISINLCLKWFDCFRQVVNEAVYHRNLHTCLHLTFLYLHVQQSFMKSGVEGWKTNLEQRDLRVCLAKFPVFIFSRVSSVCKSTVGYMQDDSTRAPYIHQKLTLKDHFNKFLVNQVPTRFLRHFHVEPLTWDTCCLQQSSKRCQRWIPSRWKCAIEGDGYLISKQSNEENNGSLNTQEVICLHDAAENARMLSLCWNCGVMVHWGDPSKERFSLRHTVLPLSHHLEEIFNAIQRVS